MFYQRNLARSCTRELKYNGVKMRLPVDPFPVKEFNINKDGFPSNDVALLIAANKCDSDSRDTLFASLAARLRVFDAEKGNTKSVKELFDSWKPNALQTPSEMKAFEEWLFSNAPKDVSVEAPNISEVVDSKSD